MLDRSTVDKSIASLLLEGLALNGFLHPLNFVHGADPPINYPTFLPDLTLDSELHFSSLVDESVPGKSFQSFSLDHGYEILLGLLSHGPLNDFQCAIIIKSLKDLFLKILIVLKSSELLSRCHQLLFLNLF